MMTLLPKLHLFNPENDLALAADSPRFTLPRNVEAFRRCGELMPLWWCNQDDSVLAHDSKPEEWEWMRREYGLEAAPFVADVNYECCPWGWSRYARSWYSRSGVIGVLPDDDTLHAWRMLSHRRTAVDVRKHIGVETGTNYDSVADAERYIASLQGGAYVKQPWSSSGRGVFSTPGMQVPTLRARLQAGVTHQGSVIVEPLCAEPKLDFAALFMADGKGGAHFYGWSVFLTDGPGRYGGNVVDSQENLMDMIDRACGMDAASQAVNALEPVLGRIIGTQYRGPLGVDMLAYGNRRLNPCIEINLRLTMGFTAMHLWQRLTTSGQLCVGTPDDGRRNRMLLLPSVTHLAVFLQRVH